MFRSDSRVRPGTRQMVAVWRAYSFFDTWSETEYKVSPVSDFPDGIGMMVAEEEDAEATDCFWKGGPFFFFLGQAMTKCPFSPQ